MFIKPMQNKLRRAIYTDKTVQLFSNRARSKDAPPVWRSVIPESPSANPKEAARVWVEDCVIMFEV